MLEVGAVQETYAFIQVEPLLKKEGDGAVCQPWNEPFLRCISFTMMQPHTPVRLQIPVENSNVEYLQTVTLSYTPNFFLAIQHADDLFS